MKRIDEVHYIQETMMMKRCRRRSAFTLIEVMLVIGILLVLGTVGVVGYQRIKQGTDKNSTKIMVDNTVHAVELYHLAVNAYPTSEEGLGALITAPDDEKLAEKWRDGGGPWLKDRAIPVDPWGSELKYERLTDSADATGPAFRIFSYGPDRQEGTDDDISSVKESGT